MGPIARPLSVLLAILLVFAGGVVDLCACELGAHGGACALAGEPTAAHEPTCCAAASLDLHPGERVGAPECACPLIVLEADPAEAPEIGQPATHAAAHASAFVALPAPRAADLAALAARTPHVGAQPRAPARRRHLELHVLRC